MYGLTETDFTNTGIVLSASKQYENNNSNNNSDVLVKPKGITVSKVADPSAMSSPTKLGDVISYTITVDNIGLLGLTGVALDDSIIAADDLTLSSGDVNADSTLDADETWIYTGSYSVTQDDIDTFGGGDGDIDNTVTVTTNELPSLSDSAEVPISQDPKFTVTKAVDKSSVSQPGALTYVIVVSNTGNQSLTGINVSDDLPDGSAAIPAGPSNDTGIPAVLDVGESWNYSISYAVTQADIDAGTPVVNRVEVTSNETGAAIEFDTAQTDIVRSADMTVSKSVDLAQINSPTTLSYIISVENTGNVTLNNLVFSDTLPDGSAATLSGPAADTGNVNALDVGETWTYSSTYSALQSDIDAQADLINTVGFTSDETGATPVTTDVVTAVTSEPSMSVEKTVDTASLNAPGVLTYQIVVNNTGNVSLSNVTPVDTLPDGTTATLLGPINDVGLAGQLDVGESWEYTTSYAVSQAEIDLGLTRTNTVDVSSTETGTSGVSDNAQTTLVRTPGFIVTKTVDLASISEPGVLNYEIRVDNNGNTSLSNIAVADTAPDGSVAAVSGPNADTGIVGTIDVGESWLYLAQYTVTQANIDSGELLTNTVSVSTAEAGSQEDTAVTTVAQSASISLVKSAIESDFTAAGDEVNYTLTATNTGNVVLSDVVISDPIADPNSLACNTDMPFTLLPSAQLSCTAVRTATIGDVADVQIVNQASVAASDSLGNSVDAISNEVIVPNLIVPPVATNNSFESPVSGVPVTLAGALDDTDANGNLDPTSVNLESPSAVDLDGDGDTDSLIVAGEGVWLVDDVTGEVSFTPEAGFTADPAPIYYTVTDLTNLMSNSATLAIDYPQTAPVAEDDYKLNPLVASPGNPTTLNILADNGSGADSDPENDIAVTTINLSHPDATDSDDDGDNDTLVVAGEGSWVLDNATGDITFTPEAGALSDPTPIEYTVSDINDMVSNTAVITIDYPQTAPIANDDEMLNQPLGQAVTLATVANDTDPENNLDPATVKMIHPVTGDQVTLLAVPEEGTWSVDIETGNISFLPNSGFISNPTPIQYLVSDTTGLESNLATETVTYEKPATLEGIVWLDSNQNGSVDSDEDRKAAWTLKVYDDGGNLVATTITDADGYYRIEGLIPGAFSVEFFNENGVFMDRQETDGVVQAGEVVNLPLPVDPGGVVYDSVSRLAVAGVTLNMVNSSGDLLHGDCLYQNQQSQVTLEDGLYAFNILPGAHASCPSDGAYQIQIADAPTDYYPNFSTILRQEGASQCGDATLGCAVSALFESAQEEANCTIDSLPGTNACEVQPQPDAPIDAQDTRYFVEFYVQQGDRNVIFNHLPIDALINDAELLLSKSVNKRTVSIGSLLEYTLSVENTKEVLARDILIVDQPPANFSLVESSVRVIQVGVDGEFDTADDVVSNLTPSSANPIEFSQIDLEPLETIRFQYLMRVGVGVVAGTYSNKATASGPGGLASNTVSATVDVVADPVLQQATLVGKVFNDRDSDGAQDTADANGVVLRSNHYGWNSLDLPSLPGRNTVNDDPAEHAAVVNMPLSEDNRFMVLTREGTRISVDHEGTISEAHVGAKARGLNAQDLRVCTQLMNAVPTEQSGLTPENGNPQEVLQIVIQNYGINEEGIPGVRLATVTGLLIETDAYGRYSIPDVDAGTTGIGQNFVLKVDPATLPQGARFTTENPYVLRIINASLNKINFGVNVPVEDPYLSAPDYLCAGDQESKEFQSVEVNLGSVFFDTDKYDVREDQRGIIIDIVKKLREYGGGEIVIEAHTDSRGSSEYNIKLAERRASTIRKILSDNLGSDLMRLINVKVDPAAYVEQER